MEARCGPDDAPVTRASFPCSAMVPVYVDEAEAAVEIAVSTFSRRASDSFCIHWSGANGSGVGRFGKERVAETIPGNEWGTKRA